MSVPNGISICTVTVRPPAGFDGDDHDYTVTWRAVLGLDQPDVPQSIVWAATGKALVSFADIIPGGAGQSTSFEAPHVDQEGFVDGAGFAFLMWSYRAEITVTVKGQRPYTKIKNFQVLVGQDNVVLDTLEDGDITAPTSAPIPAVLSVNGDTGNVVVPTTEDVADALAAAAAASSAAAGAQSTASAAGTAAGAAQTAASAAGTAASGAATTAGTALSKATALEDLTATGRLSDSSITANTVQVAGRRKNLDAFTKKLNGGGSFTVALAGASSGDETAEYFCRTWDDWAAAHPVYDFIYKIWDDATSAYITTTRQTGKGGLTVRSAADWFDRTAAELVGTAQPRGGANWLGSTGAWLLDGTSAAWVASTGYVVGPGTVEGARKVASGSVTLDLTAGAATKSLLVGMARNGGTFTRLDIRASITSAGVISYSLDGQFPTFATIATGSGTPLVAGVQTVDWSISVNGTAVSFTVNGVTTSATLASDQAAAVATMNSTHMQAIGTLSSGWKVNDIRLDVTADATAPVLTVINGSRAGQTLAYQQARLAGMFGHTAMGNIDALFVCSCSNYGTATPADYLTAVDSFLAAYAAEQPASGTVMVLQAPQAPPSGTYIEHRARTVATYKYAIDSGYGLVDTLAAFEAYPDWSTRLMRTDGQHPTAASTFDDLAIAADPNNGQWVWKEAMLAWLRQISGGTQVTTGDLALRATKTETALKADKATTPALRADGNIPRTALDSRKKLIPYFASLAKVATAPVDILFLGDSLYEGQNATVRSDAMPLKVLAQLRARRQPAGVAGGYGYKTFATRTGGVPADSTIVTAGSPVTGSIDGLGRLTLQLSGTGQKVTLTVTGHTSVDVCGQSLDAAAQFSIKLDGTTTFTGAKAVGAWTERITMPNASAHDIEVAWVSGGTSYASGAMLYNGDENAGIRVWNGGKAGASIQDLNANATWANALTRTAADLVVLGHITNDCQLRTAAQLKADYLTQIATIRGKLPSVPVLLAPPQERNASGTPSLEPWGNYLTALQEIAAADPLTAYTDLGERVPLLIFGGVDYGLMANATHYNSLGYGMWASYVTPALDFA